MAASIRAYPRNPWFLQRMTGRRRSVRGTPLVAPTIVYHRTSMDWQEVHASYGEREGVVLKIVEWMSKPLLAVKPLDRITRARKLMIEKRVNQLAVVHDGRLVGIVTDRDLRDAFPSAFDVALADSRRQQSLDPEKVSVENVMSADVVTLGADASLADAAELMRERRIGALPVIDAGKPVGIVTRSDILRAFVALAGKTG